MVRIPDNEESLEKCICGECPSYDDCMREKMLGLFCARGEAEACDVTRSGCICGSCPLTSEFSLDKTYYCEIGAAG